jgi:hypothetical protein
VFVCGNPFQPTLTFTVKLACEVSFYHYININIYVCVCVCVCVGGAHVFFPSSISLSLFADY